MLARIFRRAHLQQITRIKQRQLQRGAVHHGADPVQTRVWLELFADTRLGEHPPIPRRALKPKAYPQLLKSEPIRS